MPQARFQISPSPGGQFTFKLIAPNGETILTGERYANHTGAVGGITSVKANAPLEQRYERLLSRSNQPYFVLKAANRNVSTDLRQRGREFYEGSPALLRENGSAAG